MKQTLLTSLTLVLLVTLVTLGFTVQQVSREEQRLLTDLQYRTSLLSETVRVQVESAPSATDSARMTPLLRALSGKNGWSARSFTATKTRWSLPLPACPGTRAR
jgi:hypothetical protein